MIANSAPPFTLRNILDRVGLASMRQGFCREGAIRLNLWQRICAALGDWSSLNQRLHRGFGSVSKSL